MGGPGVTGAQWTSWFTLPKLVYAVTGSRIAFGHESGQGACPKTGKYTWKKSGKTLKFTRVSESSACSGRSGVLAHTFTQLR